MATILEKVKGCESYEVFALIRDSDDDGGCPCAANRLEDSGGYIEVSTSCWRTSDNIDSGFQDLKVTGNHPDIEAIASELKRALDATEWYNPYKLEIIERIESDEYAR